MNAYEVHCPSFNDMTLEEQIEAGINDWCVEGHSGQIYFGRTAEEAVEIASSIKLGPMVVIAEKDMGWVNAEERRDWKFEYEAAQLDAMYDSYEGED